MRGVPMLNKCLFNSMSGQLLLKVVTLLIATTRGSKTSLLVSRAFTDVTSLSLWV